MSGDIKFSFRANYYGAPLAKKELMMPVTQAATKILRKRDVRVHDGCTD
jgi:hypothetical protein